MSKFSPLGICALLAAASALPLQAAERPSRHQQAPAGQGEPVVVTRPEPVAVGSVIKATSGFVSSSYRYRSNGDDADHDLRASLGFDVNEGRKASFHFLGSAAQDLDGHRDHDGYYAFDSLADAKGHSTEGKVLFAHADVNDLGKIGRAQLGRQSQEGTPQAAYFDGASLDTAKLGKFGLSLGVYGGIPVRFYDYSTDDSLVGAHVQVEPCRSFKGRVDWMRAQDDMVSGAKKDDLFSVNLEQRVLSGLRLLAGYSATEFQARDFSLRGLYYSDQYDLSVSLSYYQLLEAQGDLALEFNPYFTAMHEIYPYSKTGLLVSKEFGDKFLLDLGADLRRVKDGGLEGAYNRDYTRFFITPSLLDCPWKGGSFSLTLDVWDSEGRDVVAFGGDFSHKCNAKLETSVGTMFSRFKYDLYNDQEREDVQTWYIKAKYKVNKSLRLNSSYEFEDTDLETYHVLKLGLTCLF